MKKLFATTVAVAMTCNCVSAWALTGYDDPQRAAYYSAIKGKRVVFVPLGMGLDLTQAWSAVMKKQADTLGYKFEVRQKTLLADHRPTAC